MVPVQRLDFGRFSKVTRTPQGGMRVPANLTRVGVFVYRRADGAEVRELRPAEEVFAEDSLATLAGAPVTDLHPDGPVSPATWRKLSIGHVGDEVKADGSFVAAKLRIQDGEAVAAVERGDRAELSCGYTCQIDATPGVFEGERYDRIQRSIRYNHVAIGPRGWGRAGGEVALRLDSNGNQEINPITTINPAGSPPQSPGDPPMKYEIDGVSYDTASPEFVQALALRDKRADTARETLTAERDAAAKGRDAAEAALALANDPARLDGLVGARVALLESARRVMGPEAKLDGKSDREIMIDTIRHDAADFDAEGKSDDYVAAYFDASTKSARRHDEGGTGIAAVRSAAVGDKTATRADAGDKSDDRFDASAARRRMLDHNRDAAAEPLRHSNRKG